MYTLILSLHSLVRWLVLFGLMVVIFRSYRGWFSTRTFSKTDRIAQQAATSFLHIQLVLGVTLYFVSPIVGYFLDHLRDAMGQREFRFFGMEHITMMIVAVAVISTGSSKSKKEQGDHRKFKILAIWFTIGLLIILSSIPWPFSPFTARPYFRMF